MKNLKILPFYTGITNLKDAILSKEGNKILFLEILLNEDVKWKEFLKYKQIKEAYQEALGWFYKYKTAIFCRGLRKKPLLPLVKPKKPVLQKERLFWEAVYFAEVRHKRNNKTSKKILKK